MELALTIILILGMLIFVVGYLKFVLSGFRQHPVTGIIAILPAINLLVVPSLWHKTSRALIIGFLGLLMVAGAWFMGADKSLQGYLGLLTGKEQSTSLTMQAQPSVSTHSTAGLVAAPTITASSTEPPETIVQPLVRANHPSVMIDESKMQSLPTKALYKMSFEEVPVKNLAILGGRIVKITDNNLVVYEGRVSNISVSSVFVKPMGKSIDVELPITNIKKLSLMVKKPL